MQKFYDYEVVFEEVSSQIVRVIARNEEEAKERAQQAYEEGRYDSNENKFNEWNDQEYNVRGVFFGDITDSVYDYSNHLPITLEQAKAVFGKAEVIKIYDDGSETMVGADADFESGYAYAIERSKFPELMDLLLEGVMK